MPVVIGYNALLKTCARGMSRQSFTTKCVGICRHVLEGENVNHGSLFGLVAFVAVLFPLIPTAAPTTARVLALVAGGKLPPAFSSPRRSGVKPRLFGWLAGKRTRQLAYGASERSGWVLMVGTFLTFRL